MKLRQTTLGAIGKWGSGGTPLSSKPEYYGGDVPWLIIEDLNDGVVTSSQKAITKLGLRESSAKLVQPGTLLIAMYGSIGKLGIAGIPCATNQAIAFCDCNPSVVDAQYLFYYLLSVRDELNVGGRGGTQQNISQGFLKEFPISLPPLLEQKRIAAILAKANRLRRVRRYGLELADTYLQSVFLEMFGDPAANPKGWHESKVESVLSKDRAGTRTGPFGSSLKRHEYVKSGIPVWGIQNLREHGFVEDGSLFITQEKFKQLTNYEVKEGDVLMSRAGTVGRLCIARPTITPSIIGTNLIRVSLDRSKVLPEYFTALFTYFGPRVGNLKMTADENAYSFLNPSTLKTLVIPQPPIEQQQNFVHIVQKFERLRAQGLEAERQAEHLFQSLLHKAFEGELSDLEVQNIDALARASATVG